MNQADIVSTLGGLISLGLTIWLVIFTVLVLKKLDMLIAALKK